MKNKQQILEEIKTKPLLQIKDFQVFKTEPRCISENYKVSNKEILKGLDYLYETCSARKTKETFKTSVNSKPKGLDLIRKEYYKVWVNELLFKESPTFFSPRFENKIKDLISFKAYHDMTPEAVMDLNSQLQDISTIEFEWKKYHRRTVNKDLADTQFSKEFKKFELSFESLKSPTEADLVGQRAERKFMH